MAMQSAWLLCRRLIAAQDNVLTGPALTLVGEGYAADWGRWFAPRIRVAAAFAHVVIRPACAAPLGPLVKRFPGLLTFGARFSGKATRVAAWADSELSLCSETHPASAQSSTLEIMCSMALHAMVVPVLEIFGANNCQEASDRV